MIVVQGRDVARRADILRAGREKRSISTPVPHPIVSANQKS
jgi:hypothetical protein